MSFVYRGLKAKLERYIITDAEVEQQLERLRQQNPRITAITGRPTRNGDEVILDYAGFCDGVQFAGGTAEMQSLVLGSGSFIPGFEEQLVDKMPGEEVSVFVTFPNPYHSEELAGKEAEFRCKLHEIREKSESKLDDDFAREVGGFASLEEMREKLAENMQAYTDQRGEMDLQDKLLRQAAQSLNYEPTEAQMKAELDAQMENLKAQLAQQGLTLEMYCQFLNTSEEKLREDASENARQSVQIQAAIETIASLENVEASEEEIGQAIAVIARQNNMTVEQLKGFYDAEFEAAVVRSVITTKVMQLIRDSAEIEE